MGRCAEVHGGEAEPPRRGGPQAVMERTATQMMAVATDGAQTLGTERAASACRAEHREQCPAVREECKDRPQLEEPPHGRRLRVAHYTPGSRESVTPCQRQGGVVGPCVLAWCVGAVAERPDANASYCKHLACGIAIFHPCTSQKCGMHVGAVDDVSCT